jgi:hypothetical protein
MKLRRTFPSRGTQNPHSPGRWRRGEMPHMSRWLVYSFLRHSVPRPPSTKGSHTLHSAKLKEASSDASFSLAEREGFEPSRGLAPPYRFSKPTPSASWVPLRIDQDIVL